jgi:S-adenosyl-L-methionine hydrolase (adenosine-forming)
MEKRLITLTTDFGDKDPFVGIMKGVILSIDAGALIVDLTNGVEPQDIRGAALALNYACPFFPPQTIHVAVVDPGVGGARRPILMECDDAFFIGPDNGVLSLAAERKKVKRVVELANRRYHLQPVSSTFHGRDIFAPAAAHLAAGVSAVDFGPALDHWTRLEWPEVAKSRGEIRGEIIYIDHFGNLITNVSARDLDALGRQRLEVSLAEITIEGLAENYASAVKEYAALLNSWGLLEISCFNGRADRRSGADVGDPVHVRSLGR